MRALICVLIIFSLSSAKFYQANRRIVGGTDAPANQYNYLTCQVIRGSSNSQGQFCTSSLIASQWILTAAHCISGFVPVTDSPYTFNPENFTVLVGTHDLSSGGRNLNVSEIHVHPNWTASNWNGLTFVDIALLKLAIPVTDIEPVLIASLDEVPLEAEGESLIALGWGATSEDGNSFTNDLQLVTLPIRPFSHCGDANATFMPYPTDNSICVGAPNKDVCFGDSGGPLISQKYGVDIQIAVTSYGTYDICNGKSVVMKIARNRAWIEGYTGPLPKYSDMTSSAVSLVPALLFMIFLGIF